METVKKVCKFCKKMQEAPKELLRLIHNLEQQEILLEQASFYLKERSQAPELPGSEIAIQLTMSGCQCTMRGLEEILDRVEASHACQSRVHKLRASIRAVVKMEDIEELHRLLHEDMSTLQAAVLMNVARIQ